METISAREANQHFSTLLRQAQAGERVIVTSRGRPVAQISGLRNAPDPRIEARKKRFIAKLRRRPIRAITGWTREELYDR